MTSYQRILVPIDGSPTSTRGLDEAIGVAKLTGASLRLLHVMDELEFVSGFESGASYAKEVVPKLRRRAALVLEAGRKRAEAAAVAVDTLLVECFARRTCEIVCEEALAWKADLIVAGTHGRRGVRRMMLGSDAEQIARTAPVPILLVRAPEDQIAEPAAAADGRASTTAAAKAVAAV
jgi:nucleotide-binding universal stress UspA family protein